MRLCLVRAPPVDIFIVFAREAVCIALLLSSSADFLRIALLWEEHIENIGDKFVVVRKQTNSNQIDLMDKQQKNGKYE